MIGINYRGTAQQLGGCINDAKCMRHLLKTKFHFQDKDIVMLTEENRDVRFHPTRANILQSIRWLVSGTTAGDSLFFHYSGHGGQARDHTGEEADGMNETLIPLDHTRAGHIVDDDLNRELINPIGQGVILHAVIDACHSGSGERAALLEGWIPRRLVMVSHSQPPAAVPVGNAAASPTHLQFWTFRSCTMVVIGTARTCGSTKPAAPDHGRGPPAVLRFASPRVTTRKRPPIPPLWPRMLGQVALECCHSA